MFTLHGIDVRECALVCVKSSTHFRAAYAPIAETIITADEPGLSSNAVENFTFTKCSAKPVGPFQHRGGKL
eukprot:COSAG05_NODE_1189_length_5574_cov_2572.551963_3_plen_71_part_00